MGRRWVRRVGFWIVGVRGNILDLYIHMFLFLNNYLELDTLTLTSSKLVLRRGNLAAKDSCNARTNTVLDLVFLHHVRKPLPETLNLESLGNSLHYSNWVDSCTDLLQQTSNEAGFVHAVFK
ncbi:hypothetical protein FVER14953_20165 [Fusarium verticillioides]|nr:hypothetical protein FVER14953_20165 [Fusarium verticillioides]